MTAFEPLQKLSWTVSLETDVSRIIKYDDVGYIGTFTP